MGMVSEFKEFISRGNVVDLAVGVVIGAAFGKIVTALVDGIVMPVVSMATGGVAVEDWKVLITPAQFDAAGKEIAAEVAIKYGLLLQTVIDFVLVAFVIFLVLKAYNRMRKPAEAAPAAPAEEVVLLREIRDALAHR
ncbi:MAG: large-conductance mechanosensitive channel protein MscL [Pseudomonas sp.]|nr:large-conductance mechanosensitive channel protein MscL [Pseudomonas sp.]